MNQSEGFRNAKKKDAKATREENFFIMIDHQRQLRELEIQEGQDITIHMTHLNHLDLTWYWRLPDTLEMCLETVRWHVELLEKHPDARYSHTQVFTLKIVEELDPPLFKRFGRLVEVGHIEIDSGQIVEPDHNMPSGESLARQFLYGQHYIRKHFGKQARILINSDSFGHARSMPQIMKQAGITGMIFKRPLQEDVDLPEHPFLWQGIDGTQMPALRFHNKGAGLPMLSPGYKVPEGKTHIQEKVDIYHKVGVHHLFGSHCSSDAGGVTPYISPVENMGYRLLYSTPSEFFEKMQEEAQLPVYDGLLNFEYHGCYTTHVLEKENCRRAEKELRRAELLWSLICMGGGNYPSDVLQDVWWRLAYLQFHDILPGTGSPEAHMDSSAHYHEIFFKLQLLKRKAQLILDAACSRDCVEPFRVFMTANPRPVGGSGVVETDVDMRTIREVRTSPLISLKGFLEDEAGNRIPYQIVNQRVYQRYARGTMIFPVDGLPPLGMKSYYMTQESAGESVSVPDQQGRLKVSQNSLENEHLRIEFGTDGFIRSIRTKKDGRENLKNINAPVRVELWPETEVDEMDSWKLGITDSRENAKCTGERHVIEEGPVRSTIRTTHQWGHSTFYIDVSLYHGQDWIEVRVEMDWHEKEVLARLCIEPNISGRLERTYGIPFGYEISNGDELEIPAVGWVDISGEDGGLALLDRDRPGHCLAEDAIRVSLVRCATLGYDPCTDSGRYSTGFRLVPHSGDAITADIPGKSDEFSHPVFAWQSEFTKGNGQGFEPPLDLKGKGIITSAFKMAENGSGLVLRLYESFGEPSRAVVVLGDALSNKRVFEANILEDLQHELLVEDRKIALDFKPFEIKTLIFTCSLLDAQ